MTDRCYWPYGFPPEFLQCVRSFAEAQLQRRLGHITIPLQFRALLCVCSDWYSCPQDTQRTAPPRKRRRRESAVSRAQALAAVTHDQQQALQRPIWLAGWLRARVGGAGFISKLLEKFFPRGALSTRDAGKLSRHVLWRYCGEIMFARVFPTMRARPSEADSSLIRVSTSMMHRRSHLTIGSELPNRSYAIERKTASCATLPSHHNVATCLQLLQVLTPDNP